MSIVFQYGSNTCSFRLNAPSRLKGEATPRGKARTLEEYEIYFDVYSHRNRCAASTIFRQAGARVWGVIYEIPDELIRGKGNGRRTLAQIEGSKYAEKPIRVETEDGRQIDAATFVANVTDRQSGLSTAVWYVSWILYGLREHKVDESYIEHVRRRAIVTNENASTVDHDQITLIEGL